MEYLKVTKIMRIKLRKCGYPHTYQYRYISKYNTCNEKSFLEEVESTDYYDILIKKNIFGLREVVTNKEIFILEDCDYREEESINRLIDLINDYKEILIIYRSYLNTAKTPTLEEITKYLEGFSKSKFCKENNYKKESKKEKFKKNIKAKRLIKEYRKS